MENSPRHRHRSLRSFLLMLYRTDSPTYSLTLFACLLLAFLGVSALVIQLESCTNTSVLYIPRYKYFFCPRPPSSSTLEAALRASLSQMRPMRSSAKSVTNDGCEEAWRWFAKSNNSSTDPAAVAARDPLTISSRCHVEWVTYSTSGGVGLSRLADTAKLLNVSLSVVGLNQRWNRGLGFRMRLGGILAHIDSLPPDRIVIATDASDVLLVPSHASCSSQTLISKFLALETPVVFGSEPYCYPDSEAEQLYPPAPGNSSYRFLNAGGYMGYAWAIKAVLSAALAGTERGGGLSEGVKGRSGSSQPFDDQRELTRIFLNQTSVIPFIHASTNGIVPRGGGIKGAGESLKSLVLGTKLLDIRGQQVDSLPNQDKDQQGVSNVTYRGPLISLDYENAVFQNLLDADMDVFEIKRAPMVTVAAQEAGAQARKMQQAQVLKQQLQEQEQQQVGSFPAVASVIGKGNGTVAGYDASLLLPDLSLRNRLTGGQPCVLHQQGHKLHADLPLLLLLDLLLVDERRAARGFITQRHADWLHRVGKGRF